MDKLVDTERLDAIMKQYEADVANLEAQKQALIESNAQQIALKVQEKVDAALPEFKVEATEELIGEELRLFDNKIETAKATFSLLDSLIVKEQPAPDTIVE